MQTGNVDSLLSTLKILRLVAPAAVLGMLVLRTVARLFIGAMDALQRQGYDPSADDVEPAPTAPPKKPVKPKPGSGSDANGAAHNSEDDDEDDDDPGILPVVVKVRMPRRMLILSLFVIVAVTFFAQGVIQIAITVIDKVWLPTLPQFASTMQYLVGLLAAFSATPVSMTFEERMTGRPAGWGSLYPRLIAFVSLAFESAITGVLARIVASGAAEDLDYLPVVATDLAFSAFRVAALLLLILSQSPWLYASAFVAPSEATNERQSLLGTNASQQYGTVTNDKPKNPLRSTRPPSSRPPPLESLSILTLFSRVRTLFPYLWPRSFALQFVALICVALMLLRRFTTVLVPLLFGRIAEDLSIGRPAYTDIILYVVAKFLSDSNTMLYRYMWLPIEQYSQREMTMLSFDCLLNLSLSYHTKRKTGELLRILDRSDAINNFFETIIFTFIPVMIDLPVAIVVLWVKYDITIVSIVFVVSVIFVWTSVNLAESRTKLYRSLRNESQYLYQIKTDTLMAWDSVKLFTSEAFESRRLSNALRAYQLGYYKVFSAWNTLSLIQDSISAIGLLVCSFILANRVATGQIGVGAFVTFVSYLASLYGPLNRIAGLYQTFMRNLVDTEQLIELLNETKDVVDRPGAVDLHFGEQADGGIEFDHVSFSYDGRKEILHDISFKVPTGKSVALVGPSGGGKSTIMRLLFRFYDVESGAIKIDGHDLRDLTQSSIRRAIGLVPQDPVLFNETARYNLAYGLAGDADRLTEAAIVEAAKSAQIHDKICSFPDGYETRVGERGQRLSGGEKQRVAIARVLLKNPSILLMDEATSALDTVNEKIIQARLKELSANRTTLAIAHRLSTVVDCDIIYVLDNGRIVESGNHGELLEKNGLYLWRKQAEANTVPSSTPTPGTSTPGQE